MFFGIKRSWLSNYTMFTSKTKRAMTLKPGLFIVKLRNFRKFNPLYGDFVNTKKYFFASERHVQNVQKGNITKYYNQLRVKNTMSKWTFWTFLLILGVRVVTFLRNTVKNITI